ncbi:RAD52 motif-containing protein 1 isoform X1 [Penaeus vannamei]|uniref:RAD52 motif-containing protein 1 isoform X1 n=1 Tax=Penaeus vannamei TaxID=6689 RepID=UPI00387FA92F
MLGKQDIEVIQMEVPRDDGHQVYVPSIIWNKLQEELEHELDQRFSTFGLVYRISVFKSNFSTEEVVGMEWYAYVIFYSVSGAKNALKQSGKIKVGETEIQIRKKHHYRPHTKRELPLYKAQELLTFYFGFNCWSSEVVYMEREPEGESPDHFRYACMVRVKMPKENLCSEGLGVAEVPFSPTAPSSRGIAHMTARRFAYQSAMKTAFSKFVIIILGNGKITVEVDTTQEDIYVYDPAWDNPVVKVNEINYDPEAEEECEDLDDITEEELNALLDAPLL